MHLLVHVALALHCCLHILVLSNSVQLTPLSLLNVVSCLPGALLAVGITNCGVQDENDPAYALICESVNHDDPNVRIGAIMGLGLAYAGTQKAEVQVSMHSFHQARVAPRLCGVCGRQELQ